MTIEEKIRLFNGDGSWKSYSANGKIPQIVMSDGPHGLRKQDFENYADLNKSNVATCFPTASCIASSWDRNSLNQLGKAIAKEALKENVNIVLGCGMNIKRSPLCGRNFEYFSEDPFLSGELAADYVDGMQSQGVGACIKHFACNNQEKLRQNSSSNIDIKTLNEIYLRGFEIAVKKSHPASIMCSYNKINNVYAAQNSYLLNEILRKKWGFNGIVISDWGACIDAPKCLKAGLDLAMPDSLGYFGSQLKQALEKGELLESDLDLVNSRLIKTAEELKIKREEALNQTEKKEFSVDYQEQHRIALKLAENSAVLLQNNGILPLNPKEKASAEICVIGELAEFMKFQAGGSSHITTKEFPNAIESLKQLGFSVDYAKGYYSDFCKRKKAEKKNRPLIEEGVKFVQKAAAADKPILFFCGLTETFEGEGFDRENLELPPEQLELLRRTLEITKKVVVVNFSGAPVNLSDAKDSGAILQMYLCGEACGEAVAALISGNANPSGKLAETWPLKIEDTPCFNNFGKEAKEINYEEKEFVGYRWYESRKIPVQFPFGFGLSYTEFEISNCSVNLQNMIASVSVKNIGSVAGSEVIQLYVTKKEAQSYKQLRGFEKVYLEPGETKILELQLDSNAFKTFDLNKNDFVESAGAYEISIGNSIKNIVYSQDVEINSPFAEKSENQEIQNENHQKENRDFSENQNIIGQDYFTLSNSLGDMAKKSLRIRLLLKVLTLALVIMSKNKTEEDPAVKIAISAITENPLESLISTSGGAINYKRANLFVKWANKNQNIK